MPRVSSVAIGTYSVAAYTALNLLIADRDTPAWTGSVPDHHKVIPPEVLDPKAMIPPSKFNFRRQSLVGRDDADTYGARGYAETARATAG